MKQGLSFPLRVTNLRMICVRQELSVGPEERKPGEKPQHWRTVQRTRPHRDSWVLECLPPPGTRSPLHPTFPVWALGAAGLLPSMWRELEDPAITRASLYSSMVFFLEFGHSVLPGPLYQEQSSFRVPVEKDYANSFRSRTPKSPQEISILPPSPPPLSHPAFNPYSCLIPHHPSASLLRSSGFLLCFAGFVSLPSGVTGNHHTSECTIHPPCSMLISINYALALDFVSLEPRNPLSSQQSLALTNENLGFQFYFPWNELQEPILEKLNTDAFVPGWLLLPSPRRKGRPGLRWVAGTTGKENYIQSYLKIWSCNRRMSGSGWGGKPWIWSNANFTDARFSLTTLRRQSLSRQLDRSRLGCWEACSLKRQGTNDLRLLTRQWLLDSGKSKVRKGLEEMSGSRG